VRTIIKVTIGIILLTVGIGYIVRRKIDTGGDTRFKLYSNVDEARLVAHQATGSLPPPTDPSTCLGLVSYKGAVGENSTVITGRVKNACDYRYSYASITFSLFDASGRVVGTAVANQSTLDGGEMWNFKARGVPAPRFKFDHISAMYHVSAVF
jgi:hypothetical protein